jgi:hypothetical protein
LLRRKHKEVEALFAILRNDPIESPGSLRKDVLGHLLIRHKLVNLVSFPPNFFPASVHEILKEKGRNETLRSLSLTKELLSIHEHLSAAGLKYVLLKGPALSHQLYDDFGKRPFNDLDLLVSKADFFSVLNILLDNKYTMMYPQIHDGKVYNYYFRHKHDVGLIHPETGNLIELHFMISSNHVIPVDVEIELLKNRTNINIQERSIPVLNPETNFLYLCIHGAHHLYFRLFWLKDISRSLEILNLDHTRVVRIASMHGLDRMVAVSLLLVKEIFGDHIPEEFGPITSGRQVMRLKNICLKRITGPESESAWMKALKQYYYLMLKPGLGYKLYIIGSIFHRWYIRKFLGGH